MILFRPFATRGVYVDYHAFRREIVKEFRGNIGPELIDMHNETVDHWKVKPEFIASISITSGGIGVDVVPTGKPAKLWWWHSEGVEGRVIKPKRHRQPKYRHLAKGRRRKPRKATLRFPGREGVSVYRRSVYWRGIAAKHHPERIANKYRPTFRRRCENACVRGCRAAQRS